MGFFFILPLSLFFSKKNKVLEFLVVSFSFLLFFLLKSFDSEYLFFEYNIFSWSLIILSFFICIFMIFSNFNFIILELKFNFSLMVAFMLFSLFSVFISSNLFFFYIFFEFSVLPIFFIICGLGFNFERLESAIYMFIYTLFFSLPFIVFFFLVMFFQKDSSFMGLMFVYYSGWDYFFVFFSVMMFFVKIPSFFLHLWLPKAHVEAPVSGSMILAGVLLKLGVYGLFMISFLYFFQLNVFSELFFVWGIWGALLASFACFYQIDLKKMIAYMSIMHMGIVISGFFSFLEFSFLGIVLMLLGHGLVSSSLFFCLNIFYERGFSRSIFLVKGGVLLMPGLFLWFSLVVSFNISIPPSMNFFSELFLIFSLSSFLEWNIFILSICIFLNSVVSFYFLTSMFHGFSMMKFSYGLMNLKEMMIVGGHLIPLLFFSILI